MLRDRGRPGLVHRGNGGSGGVTPPFTPASISGLNFWYDAADTSTIIQVAGSVSQWNDKASGFNAVQGTGAAQPVTGTTTINGKNVLVFAGTKFMTLPSGVYPFSNGVTTTFAVFRTLAAPSDFHTVSLSGGGNRYSIGGSIPANNFRGWHGVDGGGGTSDIAPQTTSPTIGVIRAVGTDFNLYINGGAAGTTKPVLLFTGTGGGIGALSGGSEKLTGTIAELIGYTGTKTVSETNQVGNYLATKWGITWTDI